MPVHENIRVLVEGLPPREVLDGLNVLRERLGDTRLASWRRSRADLNQRFYDAFEQARVTTVQREPWTFEYAPTVNVDIEARDESGRPVMVVAGDLPLAAVMDLTHAEQRALSSIVHGDAAFEAGARYMGAQTGRWSSGVPLVGPALAHVAQADLEERMMRQVMDTIREHFVVTSVSNQPAVVVSPPPAIRSIRAAAETLLLETVEDNGRTRGLRYDEIMERLRSEFPGSNTTVSCLRWYATKLNGTNARMPYRPRSRHS